jgi:hypothetical protein
MLVLFDNGTPRTLARYLIAYHTVTEARARGWEEFGNGELLTAAEAVGFEVLVTTDKNLRQCCPRTVFSSASKPKAQPVEIEIYHWRGIEG